MCVCVEVCYCVLVCVVVIEHARDTQGSSAVRASHVRVYCVSHTCVRVERGCRSIGWAVGCGAGAMDDISRSAPRVLARVSQSNNVSSVA